MSFSSVVGDLPMQAGVFTDKLKKVPRFDTNHSLLPLVTMALEDPTVNTLQDLACRKLGKESSLFVPSGTQGNLICLLSNSTPGQFRALDGSGASAGLT
jgi:hypothetical protein